MKEKLQPTRWDSKAKRTRKRLTKQKKLALLHKYNDWMEQGRDRADILGEIAGEIGVSKRQVERILTQAVEYEKELNNHFAELSDVALAIANNLSCIHDAFTNVRLDSPDIGDLVYHGVIHEIDSDKEDVILHSIDKNKALNLLAHLKKDFAECENINDWASLTYDDITKTLILKLKQKGYKSDFKGKCPACPS